MIVLDAGALIALERNDRPMWAALKLSALATEDIVVPTTVLAQVWRNRPSQALLSRALAHCTFASFDDVARAAGELCGHAKTTDICDAHVAWVATERDCILYTSDVADMKRLIEACRRRRRPIIVRC